MANRNWDKSREGLDYRREYNKSHYDFLRAACPKGTLKRMDEAARLRGISRAAWLLEAIEEKIERERG